MIRELGDQSLPPVFPTFSSLQLPRVILILRLVARQKFWDHATHLPMKRVRVTAHPPLMYD